MPCTNKDARRRVCPNGHELLPWAAKFGLCDGCGNVVNEGDKTMDCRRCNFYLCAACCPYTERDESLAAWDWGYISALPFYALDHIEDVALDVNAFFQTKWKDTCRQTGQSPPVARRSACSKSQTAVFIADFCHNFPATNMVPTDNELNALWSSCEPLHPQVVADAIDQQLSFASGDHDWQPRFRALSALEHLISREGKGQEIADLVLSNSEELIRHLALVPKCRDKVQSLLVTFTDAGKHASEVTLDQLSMVDS